MNILLNEKKSKVKVAKNVANTSTQRHLRISEIRNDTLVLKNSSIRAVLEVNAVNFNLKSEQEQMAIISSYQSFLNTLEHPVQIVIQSRKLELNDYLNNLVKKSESHSNQLLKDQTLEYVDYIKRLLEYADIMEKKFYVVVPYDSISQKKTSIIGKFLERMKGKETYSDFANNQKNFSKLKKNLDSRINTITSGLENCGLKVDRVKTSELVELFYNSYNPESKQSTEAFSEIM